MNKIILAYLLFIIAVLTIEMTQLTPYHTLQTNNTNNYTTISLNFEEYEVAHFIGANRLNLDLEYVVVNQERIVPDNIIKFDNMDMEWGIKDQEILFVRDNEDIFIGRQFVSDNAEVSFIYGN